MYFICTKYYLHIGKIGIMLLNAEENYLRNYYVYSRNKLCMILQIRKKPESVDIE